MELWNRIDKYASDSGIDDALLSAPCVICAFSGGADSSVLLRYLYHRLSGKPCMLVAAHMNHMIRGEESDCDEEFCRAVSAELNIPFHSFSADIPAIAARCGIGLEECARNERYAFLSRLSAMLGGALVATAHNATDNLETVIFNLCRGSGTQGISGIDPVRGIFIRPLLCLTSEEIRGFAREMHIEYRIDSTNADTAYTRNFIRSQVVPSLRQVNPKADLAVLRLSDAARADSAFIAQTAKKFFESEEKITRERLRKLDDAVFFRVISLMWRHATGSSADFATVNARACRSLVMSGYGRVDLPMAKSFFCHKDSAFIADTDTALPAPLMQTELEVPGVTVFGNYTVTVQNNDENIYNLSIFKAFDFDKIYGRLYVRTRQPGDTVFCGKCHKKLKKLMCDLGVAQRERDLLPVICDDRGIVFVPGVAVRDGCRASDDCNSYIYINVEKNERLGYRDEKTL